MVFIFSQKTQYKPIDSIYFQERTAPFTGFLTQRWGAVWAKSSCWLPTHKHCQLWKTQASQRQQTQSSSPDPWFLKSWRFSRHTGLWIHTLAAQLWILTEKSAIKVETLEITPKEVYWLTMSVFIIDVCSYWPIWTKTPNSDDLLFIAVKYMVYWYFIF